MTGKWLRLINKQTFMAHCHCSSRKWRGINLSSVLGELTRVSVTPSAHSAILFTTKSMSSSFVMSWARSSVFMLEYVTNRNKDVNTNTWSTMYYLFNQALTSNRYINFDCKILKLQCYCHKFKWTWFGFIYFQMWHKRKATNFWRCCIIEQSESSRLSQHLRHL